MIHTFVSFVLLLVATATPSFAQFWERTGGPGGDFIRAGVIAPNGYVYVVGETMHRSKDLCATWERVGMEIPLFGFDATCEIACAANGTVYLANGNRLWQSKDNGDTWSNVGAFTGFPYFAVSPNGLVIVSSPDSVFISSDEGATWTKSKIWDIYAHGPAFTDVEGTIYVTNKYECFRSTDDGTSWQQILSNALPPGYPPSDLKSVAPGKVLAANRDMLYVSTDRGANWTFVYHTATTIVSITPLNKDTVFLLQAKGTIERSIDGGQTWEVYDKRLENAITSPPLGLCVMGNELVMFSSKHMYKRNILSGDWQYILVTSGRAKFLAAQRSGKIHAVTTAYGQTRLWNFDDATGWHEDMSLENTEEIKGLIVDSSDVLYCASEGQMLARSGNTWNVKHELTWLKYYLAANKTRHFIFSRDPDFYVSTDNGTVWNFREIPFTNQFFFSVATAGSGHVYLGGNHVFFRSSNNGASWDEPDFPFISSSAIVRSIAAVDEHVFVGVDRTGVYFSTDHGTLWENHSEGLRDTINALLWTPNQVLFAATGSGIYEYSSTTQTWKNINDGIPFGNAQSLTLGADGRMYADTDGDGVYRSTKTYGSWLQSSVATKGKESVALSIYPNPAATTLNVSFKEPPSRLVVYDLLGQSIYVDISGEDLSKSINVSSLPTGRYFLGVLGVGNEQLHPFIITR